jgi:hypothetical protein
MADESQRAQELAWMLEPPASGGIYAHIEIPEGTTVTPEIEAAIGNLMRLLQSQGGDVEGYRGCPTKAVDLPKPQCRPKMSAPCAVLETCRIV